MFCILHLCFVFFSVTNKYYEIIFLSIKMNKFKSIALLGFLCVGSQIGFSGEQNPMFNQPIVKGQGEAIQSNQLSQEVGLLVRYLPLESFSLKMFYEKASSKFIEKLKTIGSQFRTGSVKEIDKIVEMKNSLLAIKEEMNSFSTQCVRLTNEIKLKTVKNDGTLTENDVKDHIKAEIEQKLPGVFALIIKVKNFHPVFACESLRKIRTIADEIVGARALGIEYLNEEVVKLNEIIEGAMELSRRSAYEKFYGVPDKERRK